MTDVVRPTRDTDDDARSQARGLILSARTAALAFPHPDSGLPFVSRIAVGVIGRDLHALVSQLSLHSPALADGSPVALLIGDPGLQGDVMNHPRISLSAVAETVPDHRRPDLRAAWLDLHPRSALYVDFADFRFVRFTCRSGAMNAGFSRSFTLTGSDLALL